MAMATFVESVVCLVALAAVPSLGAVANTTTTTTTTAAPTTSTTSASSVSCYACGQSSVNPENDTVGSFCNFDQSTKCNPATQKMYNMTCDIMDRMGASSKWVRQCPVGIKSCFYAEGTYKDQTAIFRGCAGAPYPYDPLCSRELQAVTVVAGTQSVDVQVQLCYCNDNTCNQKITAGADRTTNTALIGTVALAMALTAGFGRV